MSSSPQNSETVVSTTWARPRPDRDSLRPTRWSWAHWTLVISLFFGGEAAALLRFFRWPDTTPPPVAGLPRFEVGPEFSNPSSESQRGKLGGDPTFLALPSDTGFSRTPVHRITPSEYSPAEYREIAVWLPPSGAIEVPSISRPHAPQLDLPVPRLPGERTAAKLLPDSSWVEVQAPGRRLSRPIVPPVWTNSDTLPPTVVEVSLNAAGEVLSARLISIRAVESNGTSRADEEALALARRARFEPLPPAAANLDDPVAITGWQRLIVHWHSRSPAR